MKLSPLFRPVLSAWGILCLAPIQRAEPIALRDEVSLNGECAEGGTVPKYSGEKVGMRTYRRDVSVPASWAGKVIRLEFRQVNFVADVYLNDQHVLTHVGGWIPFSVDVTPHVQAGQKFSLKVEVNSARHQPYVDAQGSPLWPVGLYNLDDSYTGIVDDAWLRAYGRVCIEDAFIKTSYRDKSITVEYSLRNHDAVPRTIRIDGEITPDAGGAPVKALETDTVTLAARESRTLTAGAAWTDPEFWTPDSPNLYHLKSKVMDGSVLVDEETRQFGFREIWISGNQYFLTGVRVNLIGDSIPRSWTDKSRILPSARPETVEMLMKGLNLRIIRWHQFPAAEYLLDAADEKGLLMIDESALYARPWHKANQQAVIDNMNKFGIPAWIKGHRNHPSIVPWSAENEAYKHVGGYTPAQLKSLEDTIKRYDPTRPVIHDRDEDLAGLSETFNWHYPEGYEKLPSGSIYGWADKVHPTKPTGIGEFLACPWVERIKPDVFWWHGTWCRGLRYLNFTDIRPFVMTWAWTGSEKGARENLKNSFAPVALFDKEYDDPGIEPLMKQKYPSLDEGTMAERTLVLYNDEFRGTSVTVEVTVKSGSTVYASGLDRMAGPCEHPERYDYAAMIPAYGHGFDSIRFDRLFKPGDTFTWEGYRFTVDWMPGQTEFSLCLHGVIDGRKVAFTGDNLFADPTDQSQTGHEAVVARNSAILEEGYIYGAEYLRRLKPDLIVGGHSYVMDRPAKLIERYRKWAYEMQAAFQALSSDADYHYWFDPYWVRVEPYRTTVRAGQSAGAVVHVRNFRDRVQRHRIVFHAPPGLSVEPAVLEGEVLGAAIQELAIQIRAEAGAPGGVQLVALDVTLDGHPAFWRASGSIAS